MLQIDQTVPLESCPYRARSLAFWPCSSTYWCALDEKAARADGRVVDLVTGLGLGELDQQPDDLGGCVELATLLAGAVGEELDQVLVGGTEQVGELEVVVDQHELRLVEVVEKILPLLVRDLGLALDGVEVDVVLQHTGEGVVLVLDRGNCLVEHVADVVLEVLQRGNKFAVLVSPGLVPAGANRDEKGLAVRSLVLQQLLEQFRFVLEVCKVLLAELLPLAVELIRKPLQKQHPEDELLELRGVHLAAQDVRGLEEEGLELGEGDLVSAQYALSPVARLHNI